MGDHDICPSCGGQSLEAALPGCATPHYSHPAGPAAVTDTVLDIGIRPTMTATIQVDLSHHESIERIGEFLESMNVVGLIVASGGKAVHCTGLVISLVPATPVDDTIEENDRLAEALGDLVGDHCPSHAELEPTCPTCAALILLRDREVR